MANILDRFQWFKLQSGTTNLEIEACLFVFKSGMRGQRGRTLLQNRGGWRRLAKITRCAGRKTTDIPCALMLILRISRVKYSHTPARGPLGNICCTGAQRTHRVFQMGHYKFHRAALYALQTWRKHPVPQQCVRLTECGLPT